MVDTDPDNKSYTLRFEERPGYLYAYVEGLRDGYGISRAYWQEVADETERTSSRKLLIDENITGNPTIAEAYLISSAIAEMGFAGARIAFNDRYKEQIDVNRFGETTALNRGINVKIFNDLSEAEGWLLRDEENVSW